MRVALAEVTIAPKARLAAALGLAAGALDTLTVYIARQLIASKFFCSDRRYN